MKSWCGTIRDKLSVMIFRVLGEKAASRLPPYSTPAASSGNCPAGPEAEKNSPHSRSVGCPFLAIVDTAPTARAAGSMKLLTVRLSVCLSVCPFVPPSHHSAAARCCGGFAAVGPASKRYQSTVTRPALSSSECEQCHVVS